VIAYKFLRSDGSSVFTAFCWPLPGEQAGAWVQADVDPCHSGIHACRAADLPYWAGQVLYEIELGGEIVAERAKVVASRARLLRRIEAWEHDVRGEYTRACADRAHALAEGLPDWDATIERLVPQGPALMGFMAARIAEERGGGDAYRSERHRQAAWLAERLRL
jgi:hypothetical protein